jgi:hypothetical protein
MVENDVGGKNGKIPEVPKVYNNDPHSPPRKVKLLVGFPTPITTMEGS